VACSVPFLAVGTSPPQSSCFTGNEGGMGWRLRVVSVFVVVGILACLPCAGGKTFAELFW